MIKLLREGRAAIVTSFQVFKFMALYSIIQFTSAIILYHIASNLSPWEYLYIDLFIIIPLSLSMSRSGAYHKLSKQLPNGQLISCAVLASVLTQIIIQGVFQVVILLILRRQDWFEPLEPYNEKNFYCSENTTIFLNSLIQYIIVVITFSIGKPFRKPIYQNYLLMICLFIFGTTTYLLIMVSMHSESLLINQCHIDSAEVHLETVQLS